jgi:circadian clock protein KaiB
MEPTKAKSAAAPFEESLAQPASPQYVLRLYVAGMTPRSARAIANVRAICDEHLKGRYDLKVLDIYQQPVLAERHQIIAVPTLFKTLPLPERRIIGDLSNREQVLAGLDLRPKK